MTIYAYTCIAAHDIPRARLLARTLKRHNPAMRFVVCLAEARLPIAPESEPLFDEMVCVDQLGIPSWQALMFAHEESAAVAAIKGAALEYLLAHDDCTAVFCIDPDVAIFSSLAPMTTLLRSSAILLVPQLFDPDQLTRDVRTSADLAEGWVSEERGVYDAGFLAVRNSAHGQKFAAWWRARLEGDTFSADDAGTTNGSGSLGARLSAERWLDFVPALFPDATIVRYPGLNVGVWNLGSREVTAERQHGLRVNGMALIYMHCGDFPTNLTSSNGTSSNGTVQDGTTSLHTIPPALDGLLDWYSSAVRALFADGPAPSAWQFATFDNGELITPMQRVTYRESPDLRTIYPDPFHVVAGAPETSYFDWYLTSADDAENAWQLVRLQRTLLGGVTPLQYFLAHGERLKAVSPSPWFDPAYYLHENPDIAETGANPFLHFITYGYQEGRNPHPRFDIRAYAAQHADELRPAENPLSHYLAHEILSSAPVREEGAS